MKTLARMTSRSRLKIAPRISDPIPGMLKILSTTTDPASIAGNTSTKIVMTGNKLDDKSLRRYSGYPGGQNVESYRTVLEKDPCRVVKEAIVRMLPSGRLGRQIESRLKVYAGPDHPHQAQRPQTLEIA